MQGRPSVSPSPSVYRLDAPPLRGIREFDGAMATSVAIIGGGIVGLTTALHLAQAGVDTIVLEANEPGWGASGNNGGQLNPGLKFDPDDIERIHGEDLGRRMVSFAYDTPNRTLALIRRLGIECDARQNGTLRLAYNAKSVAGIEATARQCQARDMPIRFLDRTEVAAATGNVRYLAGLLDTRGGDLNPLSYVRGLAQAAVTAGATVFRDAAVRRLKKTSGGWELGLDRGGVRAEKILIATNGFTDDLWRGLRQTIVPVYSAIAATAPMDASLSRQILPLRASVYESGRITVYYRIDAKNRLLMGGRGPMRAVSRISDIGYLKDYARRLWPSLAKAEWTHAWNSRLAMTEDHWPHLHEPTEDCLIYLGCNGRGVALGTALAEQFASRLIRGAKAQIDLPIVEQKRIRFHGLWPLAVRSVVLHGRIMDRLGL